VAAGEGTWENVGGVVKQAVFLRLNDFCRMVMCGMFSESTMTSSRARAPI
jgi:NADPH-dependent curcumin reductase CurA